MFFMIFGKIIRLLSADIWISEIIRSSVHLRNVFLKMKDRHVKYPSYKGNKKNVA